MSIKKFFRTIIDQLYYMTDLDMHKGESAQLIPMAYYGLNDLAEGKEVVIEALGRSLGQLKKLENDVISIMIFVQTGFGLFRGHPWGRTGISVKGAYLRPVFSDM